MDNVIYPAVSLLALGVLCYRLPPLMRDWRDPARQAFVAMLVFLAVGFAFGAPIIKTPFDELIGVPNLGKLLQYGFKMGAALCIVRVLTFWAFPKEEATRRGRPVFVVFVLAESALTYFFLRAKVDVETDDFSTMYATTPSVVEFKAVFLVTLAYALFHIMRLSWRYARVAGRPFLRTGLRLVAFGGCFGVAHQIVSVAYSLAQRFDLPMWSAEVQGNLTPITGGGGGLLIITGLTLPSLGPALVIKRTLAHRYWTYQQLRPLWDLLWKATPTIALQVPSRLIDALNPRDVQYRLVRRIVEIRDGRLSLQPFLDEDVAAAAAAGARHAGLSGEDLDAVVEAAVLKQAATLKDADITPDRTHTLEVRGGEDVDAEAAWLLKVALALRSPITQAALQAEPPVTAAASTTTSSEGSAHG